MNYFAYKDNRLFAEEVAISDLAARFGTPFYVYSTRTLRRHYRVMDEAFAGTDHLICYAMKALSNLSVLKLFAAMGSGFDIVSVGELMRCLKAGADPRKIVFSGVGKTDEELKAAIEAGILMINVESAPELHRVASVAGPDAPARAGQPARQPGPRPRHPSAHLDRPSRQQVRSTARPGARVLRRGTRAPRSRSGRAQHAYRIADNRHIAVHRGRQQGRDYRQGAPRERRGAALPRSRRRFGHPVPGRAAAALGVRGRAARPAARARD